MLGKRGRGTGRERDRDEFDKIKLSNWKFQRMFKKRINYLGANIINSNIYSFSALRPPNFQSRRFSF